MNFFPISKLIYKLFLSIILVKFSVADDKLSPNQTIGIDQTLVSPSQVFELGFFTLGASGNWFFGIRYKSTPDVRLWVANRINPIPDSSGVLFGISGDGTPSITKNGTNIWSANSSGLASSPVLQLLDTGNLVLQDRMSEGYIWQSFDDPSDTWVPGMKMVDDPDAGAERYLTSWRSPDDPSPGDFIYRIDNQGLPEMVIFRGKTKMYRTGKWNGLHFSGIARFPTAISQPDMVFRGEWLVSVVRPFDGSVFTRSMLDTSGELQRYFMNSRKDSWNLAYTFPNDRCDKYGYCGPYSICRVDKLEICECFEGFSPKSKNDWELQDYSGGCTRTTPLNCSSGDGFLEVRGVKYPDMLMFWLNTSTSLKECRAECLKNCNCTAYANPFLTNGGSGCVMWFGDLIDTRDVLGADSKQNIYIRLPKSVIDSIADVEKKKKRHIKILLVSIASVLFTLGLIIGGVLLMTRRKRQALKSYNEDLEFPLFKFTTIANATNNFSTENMIGEGGFGSVYKGKLSVEEEIAVKRLSRTSVQGLEEFKNEVLLIAKLQHRNLVRLLGFCIEGEERILVYEYLPNKSLDYFVFDQHQKTLLTWPKRFDIIMGIARGLLYIHHDSRLKIIHRDFKTSNILLDGNLNPKISDFGLARIFEEDQPIARTRRVVGTYGYMAPEYALDGKFSVKSDIFSLGVVMLEIVSGKKNRGFDHHCLLGQAWLLWKENKVLEVMDDCLNDTFIESQVKRCIHVSLLCVQKFARERPVMSEVLFMLGNDGAVLPEPNEPGHFFDALSRSVTGSSFLSTELEKQTNTISDMEPR